MAEVKWDLQEHLQDMEGRIGKKIDHVHTAIQKQGDRIVVLEKDSYKVKTMWRTLVAGVTAAGSYLLFHLTGGPHP